MPRRRLRDGKRRRRDSGAEAKAAAVRIGIAVAALAVISLGALLGMDTAGSEVQVTGRLTGLYQPQTDIPPPPSFLVRLDSGEVVEVPGPERTVFRRGKRVLLFEQTSRILGRKTYRFSRYLEDEKPFFK